jgi:hypothetical protein
MIDMKNRIKRSILCIGVAIAATSCIKDPHEVDSVGQPGVVRFTLNLPGRSTPHLASRALTEQQEEAVDNIYVLAFSTEGTDAGKLTYLKAGKPVSNDNTTFEIELPIGTYDFMVVGNAASNVLNAGFTLNSTTKAQAVDAMRDSTLLADNHKWTRTTIPMWGYTLEGVKIEEDTPTITAADPIKIDLHRMLARIDVKLSTLAASGTEGGTGNANFALTEVYLANYNTNGQIAPNYTDETVWKPKGGVVNEGKGIAEKPSLPSELGTRTGMATSSPWAPAQKYDSADGLTASLLEKAIYTFEADNGSASTHSTNPCLVVGGSYDGGATSYYRVDFISRDDTETPPTYTYLDLLRNHRYTVTISSVSGPGYDTPKEAFDARSFNMEADVMEWEYGDVIEAGFDGQYTLAVSQNEYEYSFEGGSQSLTVRTDFPDGWEATVCDANGTPVAVAANWITVPATGTTGSSTVNVVAPVYSDTSADRTLYIHITAGRMILKAKVTQKAPLSPLSGVLAPPGVIGYIRGTNTLTLKGSMEYSANSAIAQYATDNFGGLSDKTVYMAYFKFGSLIALSSDSTDTDGTLESDDIITGPSEWNDYATLKANPTWAGIPVYQAADYTAGKTDVSAATYHNAANIALGKGDPCMYYFGNNGWKLPKGNPYNGYSETSLGAWQAASGGIPAGRFSVVTGEEGLFYPAAGYRTTTGSVFIQGTPGDYWSSTAYDDRFGYYLYFFSESVYPSSYTTYDFGYNIRCIIPEPTISVSPTSYNFSLTGGLKEFTVTTTDFVGTPTITLSGDSDGSWLGSPTLVDGTLTVTAVANPSNNARTGYLTLTAGTATAMLTITQDPTPDDWVDGGNQGVVVGN